MVEYPLCFGQAQASAGVPLCMKELEKILQSSAQIKKVLENWDIMHRNL